MNGNYHYLNWNKFYILQDEDENIFAYTDNPADFYDYIDKAGELGFKYTCKTQGIAIIYTIIKNEQ